MDWTQLKLSYKVFSIQYNYVNLKYRTMYYKYLFIPGKHQIKFGSFYILAQFKIKKTNSLLAQES